METPIFVNGWVFQCLQDSNKQNVPRHELQLAKHGFVDYLPELCGSCHEILPIREVDGAQQSAASASFDR